MSQHIVIVGSGLAGYSVAKEFRALNQDAEVTLITVDRGDYYSKPQLSTALAMGKTAEALLMNTAAEMAEKLALTVKTHCRVIGIDRDQQKVIADGFECHYDQLVLALGANKLAVPLDGTGVDDVCSLNTLEEYEAFRQWLSCKKHIGILGCGLVGCEIANDLVTAGYDVTVIAPDHYPLQSLVPEKVGRALQQALTEKGVAWQFCRFTTEVNKAGTGYQLLFDNMQSLAVDGVFTAIGLHPRTLLAESAGLKVERGIVTNALLQTSDPNIYAVGDCAEVNGEVRLHIAPLLAGARALAKTLNGQPTEVHYPPMPIVVKTPACPINVCPPIDATNGEWQFEGDAPNIVAQFVDAEADLRGFALTGNTLRRRVELLKLIK